MEFKEINVISNREIFQNDKMIDSEECYKNFNLYAPSNIFSKYIKK